MMDKISLYGQYIKERENREIIEILEGFISYSVLDEECFISDLYVQPEHRRYGVCSQLADQVADIAREKGCKYLTSSVYLNTTDPTLSVQVILGYGFKLLKSENNIIYFIKYL